MTAVLLFAAFVVVIVLGCAMVALDDWAGRDGR